MSAYIDELNEEVEVMFIYPQDIASILNSDESNPIVLEAIYNIQRLLKE